MSRCARVLLKVIAWMLKDTQKQASRCALEFLDEINSLQDKLRIKYSTYEEKRRSAELAKLIEQRKARPSSISFSAQDISMQGAILGLEEERVRRSNRQPLEEVAEVK